MSGVDISLLVGGPQGGGIESAGQVTVRALMLKGYDVIGTREYHSNIIGAHSYFVIRARDTRVNSVKLPVDAVIALDAESVFTHLDDVRENGLFVYDLGTSNTNIDRIAPISPALKRRVKEKLSSLNLKPIVEDAINYLRTHGIRTLGLPIKNMIKDVAERSGRSVASVARVANTIGLAAALAVLGVEREYVKRAVERFFAGRKHVIAINEIAVDLAYDYVLDSMRPQSLPDGPFKGERMIVSGNDIVAMGKIVGGLTIQTYYPITPAADEALYMEGYRSIEPIEEAKQALGLDKLSVIVIQTEDEISAINMAIGAALAGARASTTTSGPGFSLMNEAISMAVMMEAPIVITVWQRAGPSTGMATRTGQQDLLHSLFSGHGDTPKIVLSSGDHVEAFYDAIDALNWAEKFQVPVIHLLDKVLAASLKSIDRLDLETVRIDRGKLSYEARGPYKRYEITDDGISTRIPVGFAKQMNTSLEHTEEGMATEDPEIRNEMIKKRLRKLESIELGIPEERRYSYYGEEDPDVLIVSWGSNKGPILDALQNLHKEGIKAGYFQIRLFEPFPSKALIKYMDSARIVIGIESNVLEQMRMIVRMKTLRDIPHMIVKYTGRTLYEHEVFLGVKTILDKGIKRVVVGDGA